MSHTVGNAIADSLEHSLRYVDRLLVGVTPAQFARLATPGGVTIQSNHAAFVLGHLSLYGPRIVEHLGGDVAAVTPSPKFVEAFNATYRATLPVLRSADDVLMAQANPSGGRMAELFPTLGSMLTFYAGGHVSMHLGQVSAWRRMLGLPEA